jgi:ketosteroid isomerase-like protein
LSEHPNGSLLRLLYVGQRKEFFRHLAPDYVLHAPSHGSASGDYRGEGGHLRHGELLRALSDNTFRVQAAGSFLADDQWGVVPSRVTASRNGKSLDQQTFGLWRFRDGLVAEHWALPGDPVAFNDFLS